MRVLALSIALLALVALVGCGGGGGSSSGNTGNTGNTGNNGNNGNSGTTKSTGSIAGTAYATKGRIGVFARGTKRTGTQTALGNATVAVSGYSTLTTTTDSSGNFQINNVPTGAQTVVISASGYAMLSVPVTVQASPAVTQVTLPAATTAQYQWTVLVYLDADNDLEAYGLMNMLQMEAVGSTSNVAILVELARPPTGTNPSTGGYPNSLLASDAAVNGAWGGRGPTRGATW